MKSEHSFTRNGCSNYMILYGMYRTGQQSILT